MEKLSIARMGQARTSQRSKDESLNLAATPRSWSERGRYVLFCLMLVSSGLISSAAAPVVTTYLDMENAESIGTVVTPTILNTGTKTVGEGTWKVISYETEVSSTTSIKVSSTGEKPLRGPVTVSSTSYNDAGGVKSIAISKDRDQQYAKLTFTTDKPKVSIGCYVRVEGGTTIYKYHDLIHMNGHGQFGVLSFVDFDGSGRIFQIHSQNGVNDGFTVVKDQTYWVTMLWDKNAGANGTMVAKVYNADTWALLKSLTINHQSRQNCEDVRFGECDNHGGTFNNERFFYDDLLIDSTGAAYPLLPPGATVQAASTSYTDVNNAVSWAVAGDTVLIPAGSSTWTSTLTLDKELILLGSGTNSSQTIITANPAAQTTDCILVTANNCRISNFQFRGPNNGGSGVDSMGTGINIQADYCRVDHMLMHQFFWGLYMGGWNLVDNCVLANCAKFARTIHRGNPNTLWSTYYPIAYDNQSLYMVYEDNIFNITTPGKTSGDSNYRNMFSSQMASAWIFRKNTVKWSERDYAPILDGHGDDAGGGLPRGVMSVQVYDNTFTATGSGTLYSPLMDARGGQWQIYNNVLSGASVSGASAAIRLREERETDTPNDRITNTRIYNNTGTAVYVPSENLDFIIENTHWCSCTPVTSVAYPHYLRGDEVVSLVALAHGASSAFSFTVSGTSCANCQVEASSDTTSWSQIGSFLTSANSVTYQDSSASSLSKRFYRVKCGQRQSANAAGYYDLLAPPGFSMIANQLFRSPNSLDSLFGQVPQETQILKYSGGDYVGYIFGQLDTEPPAWYDNDGLEAAGSVTLLPGEGAFIHNPLVGNLALSFYGSLATSPATTSLPVEAAIVSSAYPRSASVTTLGLSAALEDQLWRYNSSGEYDMAIFDGSIWVEYSLGTPVTITPRVGESFFYFNAGVTPKTWTQTYSVFPP